MKKARKLLKSVVVKTGFASNTTHPLKVQITTRPDGFYDFREWQLRAYRQLGPERLRLMNVPMGGGKTFEICALAYDDLLANPAMRCLIGVPQRLIAAGFLKHNISFPDGRKHRWAIIPENNLLGDSPECIKRFIDFLKTPVGNPANICGRTLLCSHQTIALALEEPGTAELLKNLTVFIDEAHHVCGYENETADVNLVNAIGRFARLVCTEPTNKVTLATATFFRGDRIPILSKRLLDTFSKFRLPYDEYLRGMQHLRSFSYDFVLYRDNPISALKEIYKAGVGKSIIYLPHVCSSHTFGSKKQEVAAILDVFGLPHEEDKDGLHRGQYRGREIVAVDLVDDQADRVRRMRHINANARNPDGPDCIIALNMFKEGANYEALDHQCIIGPKRSLTEIVQIVGRLLRDVPGKESVKVHHLLPLTISNTNREKSRTMLNDYLKAVLLSMMMEDVICPHLDVDEKRTAGRDKAEPSQTMPRGMYFMELVTDDTERWNLFDEIYRTVLDERIRIGKKVGPERVKEIASRVLTAAGYPDNAQAAECIWRMLVRRTLRLSGIDVSKVDISLVREADPLGWLPKYVSEVCDIHTFKMLRKALGRRQLFLSYEEASKATQAAGIKTVTDFAVWKYKPGNIPSNPHVSYRLEWKSWPEFLGNGNDPIEFISYKEAKRITRTAGIKTVTEFRHWQEKSKTIPSNPDKTYKSEWVSWPEFLGNGNDPIEFVSYKEAKRITQLSGIKTSVAFKHWQERPRTIPGYPERAYKSEWVSWPEFLKDSPAKLPYRAARRLIRKSGIKTVAEFINWRSRPGNIPADPRQFYKRTWIDILGKDPVVFVSYKEAKRIVQTAGIKTTTEFKHWKNGDGDRPKSIPAHPEATYSAEWKSWPEFLGNGNDPIKLASYEKAKRTTQAAGIETVTEFRYWKNRPKSIPAYPAQRYSAEWKSWPEFLRNGRSRFLPYEQAKKIVRAAGISSGSQFRKWKNRPKGMPSNPNLTYRSKWKNWTAFLRKHKPCN